MFNSQIIAILAAILFPVFAKAREKAQQTSCQSNMKQLGLAMLMYSEDYDGVFCTCGSAVVYYAVVPDDPSFNWRGDADGRWQVSWASDIYPYVKNSQIFRCPSTSYNCYGVAYGVPRSGINAARTGPVDLFAGRPTRSNIMRPAEIMMIGEKGAGGGGQYVNWCNLTDGVSYYAGRANHNEGMNVTFFDGHVKWLKAVNPASYPGWPPAASATYSIAPPEEVAYNPFG